ncbi:MAG: hypothetical protein IPN92_01630 [Chromatiaceae bacterium]|nr:hypothetical protein [Chromatiaceae bacterium]
MKKTVPVSLLLAALLVGAGGASAHDDATLDTLAAPNGGQLRMAGPYHYELVLAKEGGEAKERPVLVYVTDHAGQAVSTAGASGSAILLSSQGKVTASLAPDGDNRMKGTAAYTPAPGMKAVVSIALAGKGPEQARFTPK